MIKKGIFIIMILTLLAFSATANEKINIRTIWFDEIVSPGEEVVFFIGIENVHKRGLEDVSVKIISPDGIDLFGNSASLDIRSGDRMTYSVPVYIPRNSKSGDYYVRFVITDDDDVRRVIHRILTVK